MEARTREDDGRVRSRASLLTIAEPIPSSLDTHIALCLARVALVEENKVMERRQRANPSHINDDQIKWYAFKERDLKGKHVSVSGPLLLSRSHRGVEGGEEG